MKVLSTGSTKKRNLALQCLAAAGDLDEVLAMLEKTLVKEIAEATANSEQHRQYWVKEKVERLERFKDNSLLSTSDLFQKADLLCNHGDHVENATTDLEASLQLLSLAETRLLTENRWRDLPSPAHVSRYYIERQITFLLENTARNYVYHFEHAKRRNEANRVEEYRALAIKYSQLATSYAARGRTFNQLVDGWRNSREVKDDYCSQVANEAEILASMGELQPAIDKWYELLSISQEAYSDGTNFSSKGDCHAELQQHVESVDSYSRYLRELLFGGFPDEVYDDPNDPFDDPEKELRQIRRMKVVRAIPTLKKMLNQTELSGDSGTESVLRKDLLCCMEML